MVDKLTNNKLKILGLYSSNYLAQYYTWEIGKLVKKNQVTLLPHLNVLEKDKILITRMCEEPGIFTNSKPYKYQDIGRYIPKKRYLR